ncbi:MAG: ABC transporter ATP-binding protein [Christensenellales bacterium]
MYSRFLRKYGWRYIPGAALIVVCSYIQTLSPLVLGEIFDLFDAPSVNRAMVMSKAWMLVFIAMGVFVTRISWRYLVMGNARHMECMLREQLFEHLQRMPPAFYQTKKTGDLMAYAINDINAIRMSYGPGLAMGLQGLATGALAISSMINRISPHLSFLALIPIPIIMVVIIFMGRQVRSRFTQVQKTFAEVSDRVNENVGGIRVVKAYVQEEAEIDRFEGLNSKMKAASMRMVRVSALMNPLIQLLFGVSFTIGIVYGASMVYSGMLSVGDFVAFNSFLTLIVRPVTMLGRIINILQRGNASNLRLKEVLSAKSNVPQGSETLKNYSGALEVKNLTFSYNGINENGENGENSASNGKNKPALKNISFKLEPGATLGIIGHTGSGKTSLVNALMKFHPVPDGAIFMDGVDINRLTLRSVREPYGCVPQDGFLFSSTIKENILFYDPFADDEALDEAARMADIYETIQEFPDGYDTILGERGVNLSGGQKQRVAIARALVKKPAIYLFDDALAAVDTRTEERIIAGLREATSDRTTIFIAHRASVIRHADEILLLEDGEIAERGSHEELLALAGKYAELWQKQSGEESQDEFMDEEVEE